MKRDRMSACVGRAFPVLLEGRPISKEDGYSDYFGYTPNYMRVALRVAAGHGLENQVKSVRLQSVSECGAHLLGVLAEPDPEDASLPPVR